MKAVVLLSLLLLGWDNSPLPYYVVWDEYLRWVKQYITDKHSLFVSEFSRNKLLRCSFHHSTTGIFSHKVYLCCCITNKPLQHLGKRILAPFSHQGIRCLTPDCTKCLVPLDDSGWSTHRACGISDLPPVPLGKVLLPEHSHPQGTLPMTQPLPYRAQHHWLRWCWRGSCAKTQKCALKQLTFGALFPSCVSTEERHLCQPWRWLSSESSNQPSVSGVLSSCTPTLPGRSHWIYPLNLSIFVQDGVGRVTLHAHRLSAVQWAGACGPSKQGRHRALKYPADFSSAWRNVTKITTTTKKKVKSWAWEMSAQEKS